MQDEINEQDVYTLGGETAAKKLKEVLVYKSVNATYVPIEKTVYNYSSPNILSEILTYKKRNDGTTYLSETKILSYHQNRVSDIAHLNEGGGQFASTKFRYDIDGKMQRIQYTEAEKEILATVHFFPLTGNTISQKNYSLSVEYLYNYITYSENLNFSVSGAVVTNENASTSHGTSADINYGYDFNINPFAHMHLPDLKFSNLSIHNKNVQYAVYAAGNPETKPVNYTYSYDSDGYPIQQIVEYNYVLNGQPAYAVKSVFRY